MDRDLMGQRRALVGFGFRNGRRENQNLLRRWPRNQRPHLDDRSIRRRTWRAKLATRDKQMWQQKGKDYLSAFSEKMRPS
jgi:hypothetical protein